MEENIDPSTGLFLVDNVIIYICRKDIGLGRIERDWSLEIKNIAIIAMKRYIDISDDDAHYIVIFDKKMKEYSLNTTYRINGCENLKKIREIFNIEFDWEKTIDKSFVLFPKQFYGKPLYSFRWGLSILNFLRWTFFNEGNKHGVLTKEIENYIQGIFSTPSTKH
jgi:hypothetical protein